MMRDRKHFGSPGTAPAQAHHDQMSDVRMAVPTGITTEVIILPHAGFPAHHAMSSL
jgi:hypothetical protein